MKLDKKIDQVIFSVAILVLGLVFVDTIKISTEKTFAEGEDADLYVESDSHFVTFFDDGQKLIVKTDARTVGEAIERAHIILNQTDSVEPSLDSVIDMDDFHINIYRSYPVVLIDGKQTIYQMTSSRDIKSIFEKAGITVYDGDEIKQVFNSSFLETGLATTYELIRKGGERLTVEEEIPFTEESTTDYSMTKGMSKIIQHGEIGRKKIVYEIKYVNGVEARRDQISEEVIVQPVKRIIALGGRVAAKTSPSENEQITWNYLLKQGFSEVQTAGIMGNLQQEHHFGTDDTAGGIGIAQWTGGRRNNVLSRPDPYSIYTQLDYLMEELNGSYAYVKNAIMGAATIEDATRIFQNKFERCGICREENRISFGYEIYERYRSR